MQKVWYVTGASKGLGLALVKKLLKEGHKVAATSRNKAALAAAVGDTSDAFLPLAVNLSDEASIESSIHTAQQHFGRLDVIVNNAGYGIGGSVEELSTQEITQSVDINFYAPVFVIKHAMPYLRKQRSGHIINISSIAGFAGGIGWSMYSASKYAVIGLSEGLAQDVKELGIQVTALAPGAFRTEFLSGDSIVLARHQIDEYKVVRESHAKLLKMNGEQAGDPEVAAQVMINIANQPDAPTVLFLGSDAYNRASAKMDQMRESLENHRSISISTDFK